MPRIRRSKTIDASVAAIWPVVGDPHHLPRWWPRVMRVEDVSAGSWTEVLHSDRGRAVRADFTLIDETPERSRSWTQELAETPFERIMSRADTTLELEPEGSGTRVTLTAVRKLRGLSRFGGRMVSRAARKQLDEALEGLERICARDSARGPA